MTRLSLTTAAPATAKADALVVGIYSGSGGSDAGPTSPFDAVAAAVAAVGGKGKAGEVTVLPGTGLAAAGRVIAVGLGDPAKITGEIVRKAAGAASRKLAGLGRVVSTLGSVDLTAAAEGHLLGAYVFDRYKEPSDAPVVEIALVVPSAAKPAKEVLRRAVVTAEAVALARDLVNTPPNDLFPASFAERASAAAGEAGLKVDVLDEKALTKGGYGGILAVGGGSTRKPRLVRVAYKPAKAVASVALVGKGITFDSGGLSIKPAANMDHMTSDMSGAAAVVATAIAAAVLELPVAVTAYAALAENLPSGSAYRPGDVITHYAPKGERPRTSHVLNTDAEGRLVLVDAIARATEDRPDYLLETSTLTGAQVVALGTRTMGVMGTESLRDRVAQLAREVGEGGWAMPFPEELREGLDSPIADIANVAGKPAGGMLLAGIFMQEWVPDDLPWAHLDVAGPAFNSGGAYGYTGPGGTGVPVRTLLATLADIAAAG